MAQAMLTPKKNEEESAIINVEDENPETPVYYKNRSTVLTTNEVNFILKNPNMERITHQMAFQPQGGEVYVFIPNGICTQEDWRTDGYSWINQGTYL